LLSPGPIAGFKVKRERKKYKGDWKREREGGGKRNKRKRRKENRRERKSRRDQRKKSAM